MTDPKEINRVADIPGEGAFLDSLKRNNLKIKADRALAISEDAELQYKRTIEDLQVELKGYKRTQDAMLDMSPDNTFSMKMAIDFKPKEYVTLDLDLGVKIRNTQIKLDIAVERYAYLFEGAK